jgi:hypothetical protein
MTIKGIKQPEPRLEFNDDEARHSRHEARELDRRHQRERERLCLPLAEWTPEQRRDLTEDVTANPIGGRMKPARCVQHGPVTGRQVNPFLQADTLNRPLQKLRVTTALSRQQVAHLHEIVLRANCMGLVMDTLVTISWKLAGIVEADVSVAQSRVMRRVREWSASRSVSGKRLDAQLGWIWVQERGDTVGVHTHFLFSCPQQERTRLSRVIQRAVATAARSSRPGAIGSGVISRLPLDERAIDLSDRPDADRMAAIMRRQWTLFGYITKTRTVSYKPKPGVSANTGRIVGKRAGFSHHLLGAVPWKRFAADHGRPATWMKEFLKTSAHPFPLAYGVYTAQLLSPPMRAADSAPGPDPDAYPKTPDKAELGLRALKVPRPR